MGSVIATPEKSSDESAEEEDEMTRVVKDTVAHVILHDKEELSDLLMELRDEVGKEFLGALLHLELLAGKFLIDEFQEGDGGIVTIDRRTETKVVSISGAIVEITSCKDVIE